MELEIVGKRLNVRREGPEMLPGPKALPKRARAKREKFIEETILRTLSMNANASLTSIGKKVGLNEPAMHRRLEALKKKYNIEYLPEIDVDKLGYLKFLIFVKFLGKAPSASEIKEATESQSAVQLCLLLSGNEYDLIIYILAESNREVQKVVSALRDGPLIKYKSKWITTPFFDTFNFVPLRNEFISSLNNKGKEKLWRREWSVLKELNKNGAIAYSDIDELHEFDHGMAQYSYHTLVKKGIIRRMTISLKDMPVRYSGVVLIRILSIDLFVKNKHKLMLNILQETKTPTNRYLLVGDTGDYSLLILPVLSVGDLQKVKEEISRMNIGVSIKTMIIEQIITGKLCYRKVDSYETEQFVYLAKSKNLENINKTNHRDTSKTSSW